MGTRIQTMPAARTIDEASVVFASTWVVGQCLGLLDDKLV